MSPNLTYLAAWLLLWLALAASCGYAFRYGGPAERSAAVLILLIAALSTVARIFFSQEDILVPRLIAEGVAALGFLALAFRFSSPWIGGVMILQAAQFSIQAFYFVTNRHHDIFYVVLNNLNFLGILICLALGAWAARRRLALREAESTPPETL